MEATTTASVPRFDEFVHHPDDAITAYSYFEPTEAAMKELVEELFSRNWQRFVVGPCIEGAVFEVCFTKQPDVRISDGYLTVDLGPWHFHLCIGPHKDSSSDELHKMRPVAKIGFFERRGKGCAGGRSWGLRMWNGYGEQMTTVFLPNPRLTDDMQLLKTPDWSRLDLYYRLRSKFLNEPVPGDVNAGHIAGHGPGHEILTPAALHRVFGVHTELLSTSGGDPVYVFHRGELG